MSRSGFQSAFRRAAGVTFGRFCMQTRLAAAAHLLTRGELTIKAIAAKTGFWDDSHFHRCFLMEYGETPAQYRERQRSAANESETTNAAGTPLAMADGE